MEGIFISNNMEELIEIDPRTYRMKIKREDGEFLVIDPMELKEDDKEGHEKWNCVMFAANKFDERGRIVPI